MVRKKLEGHTDQMHSLDIGSRLNKATVEGHFGDGWQKLGI